MMNTLDRNSLISKTFNALKWILALLVVVDHFTHIELLPGFESKSTPFTYVFSKFVAGFIRGYQVPLFFVMSGFLFCFGSRFDYDIYRRKVLGRLRSLGVPYLFFLIWGFIFLLIDIRLCNGYIDWGGIDYLNCLTGYKLYPANVPLWYLRDLFIMVLLTPVIHWLLRKSKGIVLILFSLGFICSGKGNFLTHFSVALFFFSTGYAFRLYGIDLLNFCRHYLWHAVIISLTLIFYAIVFDQIHFENKIKSINIILSIPIMIGVVSYLVEKHWVSCSERLVAVTFFIYLTHHPFRDIVGELYILYWPEVTDIRFILSLACAVTVLLAMLAGIHRLLCIYAPGFLSVITGSRMPERYMTGGRASVV